MAAQHDFRLQSEHSIERLDPVQRPPWLGTTDRIKIGKRVRLRSGDAEVVVSNERRFVGGDPNRQMVRRFSMRTEEVKLDSSKDEAIALIEKYGGFYLPSKVSCPWPRRLCCTVECRRISRSEKALQPSNVMYKLNVISLGDDL